MRIALIFKMILTVAKDEALLDSGATENFLDLKAWKELRIGRFHLRKPILVRNVDGTSNSAGSIEYYCWLKIRLGKKERRMRFFLTNLGDDQFILGYPFLYAFNPRVDWKNAQLKEESLEIETMEFQRAQERVQQFQRMAIWKHGRPDQEKVLYLQKTTTAQKWAQQRREKEGKKEEATLPEKYQKHWKVFDEKSAQRFPPKRGEDWQSPYSPMPCKL